MTKLCAVFHLVPLWLTMWNLTKLQNLFFLSSRKQLPWYVTIITVSEIEAQLKLEQLEPILRFPLPPPPPPPPPIIIQTSDSHPIPSHKKTTSKLQILKKLPKIQILKLCKKPYMRHTFWSCLIRCKIWNGSNQNSRCYREDTGCRTDRWMDRRLDAVKPIYNIPPNNFIACGVYLCWFCINAHIFWLTQEFPSHTNINPCMQLGQTNILTFWQDTWHTSKSYTHCWYCVVF